VGRRGKKHSKKPTLSLKARWLSWYASRSPVFRFGLKFGAWLALYYVLFSTPFFESALFFTLP